MIDFHCISWLKRSMVRDGICRESADGKIIVVIYTFNYVFNVLFGPKSFDFKLILCCFYPKISHHTKEKLKFSILFRLISQVGKKNEHSFYSRENSTVVAEA